MIEDILKIPQLIKNNEISFSKHEFIKIFEDYSYYAILENISLKEEEQQKIIQNIKESQIIIFSQSKCLNKGTEHKYLILGFEKTLIILDQSTVSTSFLLKLVSINSAISVCFLSNTKNFVKEKIEIHNQEIEPDEIFQEEIINFKNNCSIISNQTMIKIYSIICPCILGYLIKKSYFKTKKYRIGKFIQDFENNHTPITISEGEYAELRIVGIGNLFICILIYHIKKSELYVIKKPKSKNPENTKLIKRESENYSKIMHPFLPKFIGRIKDKDYIVIEYIKGQTLEKVEELELSFDDLTTVIFELLVIIKYFHDRGLIYRDIKPNNIMIDEQKTVVMIDFDRLIESGIENDNFEQTLDLNTDKYMAPEIFDGEVTKYSFKSDIYSLGKVVEYLINQTESYHDPMKIKYQTEYSSIKKIFNKCIVKTEKNRPSISDLMNDFISNFQQKIFIEGLYSIYKKHFSYLNIFNKTFKNYKANQPKAQYILGVIYYEGQYVTQNINKAIHYLSLAANQNYPKAQFNLGAIYYEGQYVTQNIDKAIHYYSLAANQNHPDAQFKLGTIYYEGQYVTQNIDKAIHYYSLAANQNYPKAQYILGVIYYEGKYVTQNINKAIHYYSLAANQNYPKAQFNLGAIYYEGQYVKQNINKAIHYLSLAANQNHPKAQFNLGTIYYEGQYVTQNIDKAIHYLSLAANQNDPDAQFNLGTIYYKGQYVTQNIDKAIHYYSLAANQNYPDAQFNLGVIYDEGKYVTQNINKAIHYYLSLAANQNYLRAQFNLGTIYYEGRYVTQNIDKAIHFYSLAANQNYPEAQYILGVIYDEGKYVTQNIDKAIHYYSLAANQNHPNAQYILGVIYDEGKYVTQNINKAIHYYSLAANQNHPEAQYILGAIYYKGQYVTQNIDKAIHYLLLAANQNDPDAQFNLGVIYYEGKYVTQNINKAIHYLSLAANQNYPKAQLNLGVIYYEGKYVTQNIDKAIHYYSLAANQNHPDAQFNLGVIYDEGKYVTQNINKAIHYYSLAANQNNPKAQFNLSAIYYEGQYVTKNVDKAIHYLSLAANQNLPHAQLLIGFYYFTCVNSVPNIKKSTYYIMLASINGERTANFIHGFLLHEGKNVKRDIDEAIHYYKEASSFNIHYAKNNLGIIFKHGFPDKIKKCIGNAIVYFEEAIRQKKDFLSMYNLAHLYMYDETIKEGINKSIELLIKSSDQFKLSKILLCILLVKQFGFNIDIIKEKIEERTEGQKNFSNQIIEQICHLNLFDELTFEIMYESYRNKDFLYSSTFRIIESSDLLKPKEKDIIHKYPNAKDISSLFYEGFGEDL